MASVTRGTATVSFEHDPEHQRYKQTSAAGSLLYLNDVVTGVSAERFAGSGGGTARWTNYLYAGGGRIGMRIERDGDAPMLRYFHSDRLCSITTHPQVTASRFYKRRE